MAHMNKEEAAAFDEVKRMLHKIEDKLDQEMEEEKEKFAKLDKHIGEAAHDELEAALKMAQTIKNAECIHVNHLPKAIQPMMKIFDGDGNGEIDTEELMHAAEMYKAAKDKGALLAKMVMGLGFLVVVLVGAMAGVTLAMIEVSKEQHTGASGMVTPVDADVPVVASGGAASGELMSSANDDFFFSNLNKFVMAGAQGKTLSLKTHGFIRQPCTDCASGDVVSLLTSGGIVDVTDSYVEFTPNEDMLAIDPTLKDFDSWKAIKNAENVFHPTGRGGDAEDGNNRRLLEASEQTLADVYAAAGFSDTVPSPSNDLVTVADKDDKDLWQSDYIPTGSYLLLAYDFLPYQPGVVMSVPGHAEFALMRSDKNSILFTVRPDSDDLGLGVSNLAFKAGGKISGYADVKWESSPKFDQGSNYGGTMQLQAGGSDVGESMPVTFSTTKGFQIAYQHVILPEDFSEAVSTAADAHPNVQIEFRYTVMFNIKPMKGQSMKGATCSVRLEMSVASTHVQHTFSLFEAHGDFGSASMTMTTFGNDVDLSDHVAYPNCDPQRRRLAAMGDGCPTLSKRKRQLLQTFDLNGEIDAKIGAFLDAVDAVQASAVKGTGMALADAEDVVEKSASMAFLANVAAKGGDPASLFGEGGFQAVEWCQESTANTDACETYTGTGGYTYSARTESPATSSAGNSESEKKATKAAKGKKKTKAKKSKSKKKKKGL